MSGPVGHVAELWRYPVKSMQGARVDEVHLDARGAHADRLWAVRDVADRRTTSARRLPALLGCRATYAEQPGPDAGPGHAPPVVVTLPGGDEILSGDPSLDQRLSALCDRDVRLVPLPRASDRGPFRGGLVSAAAVRRELGLAPDEPLPDAAAFPAGALATLARYSTPPGMFADLAPVHLLTTQAVRAVGAGAAESAEARSSGLDEQGPGGVDPRRFRPTALLELVEQGADPADGYPERAWVGGRVRLGHDALLPVTMPTVRCVVPTREQPGLSRRREVGRALASANGRFLGVYADVARPGTVRVGDEVHVEHDDPGAGRAALQRVRRMALRAGGRLLG